MRIVITCGPSISPIDQVRRLTNVSTGELGTLLAKVFAEAGHGVTCFRATSTTFAAPLWPVEILPFSTNDDLWEGLRHLPARDEVDFIFHAAALCDYQLQAAQDAAGKPLTGVKIGSGAGPITLILEPAPKLIGRLRAAFPATILVGWKYELEGTPAQARARGQQQIDTHLTDACVVNGTAYGTGFGLISRDGEQVHLEDKLSLCRFLLGWAERMPRAGGPTRQPSVHHPLATFIPMGRFI